jgi:hypothetical protein
MTARINFPKGPQGFGIKFGKLGNKAGPAIFLTGVVPGGAAESVAGVADMFG